MVDSRDFVIKVPRGLESIIESGEVPTVSESLLKKVVREAEVVSSLEHPNILKLLGYSSRAPVLIYEFANYGSIETQLGLSWRPNLRDVILLGIQIGDALRYIHSKGLIHGDIKSANIFLVNGVAKLGDFSGLVRLISQSSSHSKFTYTPGWRAPEQVYSDLRRKDVALGIENRIDVYQLGNLILYLMTGDTIDGEDSINESLVKDVINRIADEELKSIVKLMLIHNAKDRLSSEEVVKELYRLWVKRRFK